MDNGFEPFDKEPFRESDGRVPFVLATICVVPFILNVLAGFSLRWPPAKLFFMYSLFLLPGLIGAAILELLFIFLAWKKGSYVRRIILVLYLIPTIFYWIMIHSLSQE